MEIIVLIGPNRKSRENLREFFKETGIPELVLHTTNPDDAIHRHLVSKVDFKSMGLIATSLVDVEDSGLHYYGLSPKELEGKGDRAFVILYNPMELENFRWELREHKITTVYVYRDPFEEKRTSVFDTESIRLSKLKTMAWADCCVIDKEGGNPGKQLLALLNIK